MVLLGYPSMVPYMYTSYGSRTRTRTATMLYVTGHRAHDTTDGFDVRAMDQWDGL